MTKAPRNSCPTCKVPGGDVCRTKKGLPTVTHIPRARGEWMVMTQCLFEPRGMEQVGAACRWCGHTNLVHPQHFANPALTECLICALFRSLS